MIRPFTLTNRGNILASGVLATLLALLIYVGLPALGFSALKYSLGMTGIVGIIIVFTGSVFYSVYYQWVLNNPFFLLVYLTCLWPLFTFIFSWIKNVAPSANELMYLLPVFVAPAMHLFIRSLRFNLKINPAFLLFTVFFLFTLAYRLFHSQEAALFYAQGSIVIKSFAYHTHYFYLLLAMGLVVTLFKKTTAIESLFHRFNQIFVWFQLLQSLILTAVYPLKWFTMSVDGYTRINGLYGHPNLFAHHMALVVLFMLFLNTYYALHARPTKHFLTLIRITTLLVILAFLLSLGKTAIATCLFASSLFIMLTFSLPKIQHWVFINTIFAMIFLPLLLGVYQFINGNNFIMMLLNRFNRQESFIWRQFVSYLLIQDFDLQTLLFGKGYAASNVRILQLTYHNPGNTKPLILIHNAYVNFLYDYGVMGLLIFAAALTFFVKGLRGLLRTHHSKAKLCFAMAVAMTVYYLIVAQFDETTYMFDFSILYWVFTLWFYLLGQYFSQRPSGSFDPLSEMR
jgi:hypothetical protein